MSYEHLQKISHKVCAVVFQMTSWMVLTPVTTTAAMIFLLLLMCWCIIFMVIVIDIVTVFKGHDMKWKQSLGDMTSFLFSFGDSVLKNTILDGKRFVSEIFPMVLFHTHQNSNNNKFLTFEPNACILWMPPCMWLAKKTEDLLNISRVYHSKGKACPVEQLLPMP